jgi:hypothetical protein
MHFRSQRRARLGRITTCTLSAIGLFAAGALRAAEFYVSGSGHDANPGTRAKPFATLDGARDHLRGLRRQERLSPGGDTIWVGRGDYVLTNSLELTTADSGNAESQVVWRAVANERPRLLGGRRLSGFAPVTDPATLARLNPSARGNVLQLDLRGLGISDFGEMKSRGFGRPLIPAHPELFFQHRPMTLARWPNEGAWESITGFPEANAQNDGHGGKIGKLEEGFNFKGDRPRAWKDTSDLWVHGYWSWDWANSYEKVSELNSSQSLVKTGPPYGLYGFRKGQRFYFLNLLEELDQPGEWYHDRQSGRLYFWPPSLLGPRDEVLLSLLGQPLVKITGASHIRIQGLTLEAARGNAVEIRGGASNSIAGCLVRNIGNYGVRIEGGAGHQVLSCDILDTGDGGVSLQGGDRQTLAAAGHVVENCEFARQGRWSKCYVPAILIGGVGMRASHNLIHDHPHCAILFTGNDHLIERNEIHHVALETGDVGAIYTGRDYTYRGNRIWFNFIHHTGGVGMGSMGVYMDDCVSGTEIFGNVFYKVQRAAFLGGGRDHQVVNNVFVECDHAVELDGRGLDGSPVWHDMVDKTMRKHLEEVPLDLYRARYPAMKTLDSHYGAPGKPPIQGATFKGVPPEGNLVARNVCMGKWLKVGWHATADMLTLENNLTNAVSEFVTAPGEPARATDFAVKPGSAAWKLGFQKIPLAEIGLHREKRLLPPSGNP